MSATRIVLGVEDAAEVREDAAKLSARSVAQEGPSAGYGDDDGK